MVQTKVSVMTLDLETSGLDPLHDIILLISYRFNSMGEVFQIKTYDGEKPGSEFLKALSDPYVTKRGHNCRFDLHFLCTAGYTVAGPIDDTRIIAYAENPIQEVGLKALVEKRLNRKPVKLEELGPNRLTKTVKAQPWYVKSGNTYVLDKNAFECYNKADVINCDDLRRELVVTKWYRDVEQPLAKILFETERRGIQLEMSYLKELDNEFKQTTEQNLEALNAYGHFNPNSPAQVKNLFSQRGIALDSTDKHTLKLLSWTGGFGAGLARAILEYRSVVKLKSTYTEPLLEGADERGRIHGSFNQAGRESASLGDIGGTKTGRLSSSNPNLQNIPDRTIEGKKVRKAFIATPGNILIDSDLKQIEPRLIAHYSQSKVLLNAYEKGLDTHAIMGGLIFNKRPNDLTKLERFIGKTSWLATVYGCWFTKLRKIVELNSDDPVAYDDNFYKRIQDSFWQANPEIRQWREQHIQSTINSGQVNTIGGRSIVLQKPAFGDKFGKSAFEREAVNFQIQGSAADVMKLIIVSCFQNNNTSGSLLATIHDEILLETVSLTDDAKENAVNNIRRFMTETVTLKNVPMEADTKIIKSWADK